MHLPRYSLQWILNLIFYNDRSRHCAQFFCSFVKFELLICWKNFENVNFPHFRDKCTSPATVCDGFWSWYFIRIHPDTVHNSSSQFCEIYLLFEIFWKWQFCQFLVKMCIFCHCFEYILNLIFYLDRSMHCTWFFFTVLWNLIYWILENVNCANLCDKRTSSA